MAKYDGLIIPRSYNDYINKSDPLAVTQALQLTGVMDNAPAAQSTKPAKSGGIFAANAVIMASGATLSGVAISAGSVVRVLFTADLTGSDATTGLTLTYNGNAYAVKVGKNGALAAFVASEISSGVFKYLQAYTTLELMFDGTQFIIIGAPVVLSSAGYTIYADGSNINKITSIGITITNHPVNAVFYKVGKVVYFSLQGDWTELNAGSNNVGTIPLEYRPIYDLRLNEAAANNGTRITLIIQTDGIISAYNYNDTFNIAKTGNYTASWITNN